MILRHPAPAVGLVDEHDADARVDRHQHDRPGQRRRLEQDRPDQPTVAGHGCAGPPARGRSSWRHIRTASSAAGASTPTAASTAGGASSAAAIRSRTSPAPTVSASYEGLHVQPVLGLKPGPGVHHDRAREQLRPQTPPPGRSARFRAERPRAPRPARTRSRRTRAARGGERPGWGLSPPSANRLTTTGANPGSSRKANIAVTIRTVPQSANPFSPTARVTTAVPATVQQQRRDARRRPGRSP